MNKKSRFRQIQTSNANYCLDVYGGLKKSNVPIISFKCHTGTNQKWNYKNKKWISLKNKQCLDVMGGQYDNGSMIVYDCHKGSNQQFK